MAIINLQRNHVGIQNLNTQFANYAAAGQGAMLQHTDGYIYCVFAQNYLIGVANERHLYMTRSNDGGLTWAVATDISTGTGAPASTGYWDDDPAIIQLDTTNVNSDIGVVFSRGDALTRVPFAKDTGKKTQDFAQITGSISNKKWPSVVYINGTFQIYCLVRDSINTPSIYQYSNVSFTTNAWSETVLSTIFTSPNQPMSLSVKVITGALYTHLAMGAACRTNLNGTAASEPLTNGPGMSNLPSGTMRCDVFVAFSNNNGSTWSTATNITNYAGTPLVDMVGIPSVASVDVQQLSSDGSIVVAYQEHMASQYIDNATTPFTLPSSISSSVVGVRYHTSKNTLICGATQATYGGVFVFGLSAQTLYTIQNPTLWSNNVTDLDISPDGTKMAVAFSDGGIQIFDITASNPASWVLYDSLYGSLQSLDITKVRWDGNGSIVFSYAARGSIWGGVYSVGSHATPLALHSSDVNPTTSDFIIQPSSVVVCTQPVAGGNSLLESVSKTTGLVNYHSSATNIAIKLFYDSINSEYLALDSTSLVRLIDSGSAFIVASGTHTFSAATNPGWDGLNNQANFTAEIPGYGFFAFNSGTHQYQWYSYASRQPSGYKVRAYRLGLGENASYNTLAAGLALQNNTWLALPGSDCLTLQNLVNVGRIRYGFFGYDATNRQLLTSGVNFYDVCNINKVGTNMTTLQFPKFCADNNSNLFWYFNRWDLRSPGGNEFAPVIGVTALDAVNLTARCRIRATNLKTLTARCRIQAKTTATIQIKARIAHVHCIKMRAHIVGRTTPTISMLARISNYKTTTCVANFLVQAARSTSCRLTFYAGLGYTTSRTLSLRARIAGVYSNRVTGHFIVKSPNNAVSFTVLGATKQTLSLRARIV